MAVDDDAAFIAVMELAIDWHLPISDEQWERYQKLMEEENNCKKEYVTTEKS